MQAATDRLVPTVQQSQRVQSKSKSSQRRIGTQLSQPQNTPIQSRIRPERVTGMSNSQVGLAHVKIAPIVINRSKFPQRAHCKTSYNNIRTVSGLIRPQSMANDSRRFPYSNQRKTERQKFIDILQSRVLNSDSNYKGRVRTVEDLVQQINVSHRYRPVQGEQTERLDATFEMAKQNPVINVEFKTIERKEKQSLGMRLQQNRAVRNRSKTLIAHSVDALLPGEGVSELSKTIEVAAFQVTHKMKRSLLEIDKVNMGSPRPQRKTQQTVFDNFVVGRDTQREDLESNMPTVRNTEMYNEEIQHLTSDFFMEWQKMAATKSQIYQQLRNKFVKEFPDKRKHYTSYDLPEQEQDLLKPMKKESFDSYNAFNGDLSNLRISQNYRSSNISQSNQLSDSQLKGFENKQQLIKQKTMLRGIFQQACFWSRTKNKFMSSAYPTVEDQAAARELNNIKKRLTFMSYIKDKEGKVILKRKNKIRGMSIIRNKESILELQKEGSREQTFLKKCLDDAIEDCIQENQ